MGSNSAWGALQRALHSESPSSGIQGSIIGLRDRVCLWAGFPCWSPLQPCCFSIPSVSRRGHGRRKRLQMLERRLCWEGAVPANAYLRGKSEILGLWEGCGVLLGQRGISWWFYPAATYKRVKENRNDVHSVTFRAVLCATSCLASGLFCAFLGFLSCCFQCFPFSPCFHHFLVVYPHGRWGTLHLHSWLAPLVSNI